MAQQVSVRHKSSHIANVGGDSAFTLIELLVVIVIVGIVSAVALLSFGILGDDRNLQREARRMGSLIELANDEATMQGRDYGLEIMQSGYRFVEHDPFTEQWHEIIGDETLRPRQLEEQMEFELFLEDRRILLEEDAAVTERDEDDDDTNRSLIEDYIPHVLILSSGDITPFELRIVRQKDRTEITMTMSLLGEFEIQTNDQQAF
ncbi:MAG: type II secretion system protein GspH [Gammaproteobacteria bacterium]|nr:MAG: type II secretion system protein GspH [Gammaproteobacteria bacterium]